MTLGTLDLQMPSVRVSYSSLFKDAPLSSLPDASDEDLNVLEYISQPMCVKLANPSPPTNIY